MRKKKSKKGVTMVELMVTCGIIGVAVGLGYVGLRFLSGLFIQTSETQGQAEIQPVIYNITKTATNSAEIIHASSDTLKMRVFNFVANNYQFNNPAMFQRVNFGTVTYQYVMNSGVGKLERTVERLGSTNSNTLLRVPLVPPDATDPMFQGFSDDGSPPYDFIEVVFRLRPTFKSQADIDSGVAKIPTFKGYSMQRQSSYQ